MDNYMEMLQQQSWLNMLDSDSENVAEPAPGCCGVGASAGFGGGGAFAGRVPGFGPFQMFVGGPPFGPPPHGGPPHDPPHHGPGGHHGPRGHHGCPPHGCPGRHGFGPHHGPPGPRPPFGPPPFGPRHGELPRVDIVKEAHQFVLEADVPGFSKKDVDVKIADNKLTIKGKLPEHEAEEGEEREVLTCERCPLTSFDRTFRLWDDIDASKITAKLEHGILRIVMPLKKGAEPKDIPVDSSDDDFETVAQDQDAAGPNNA